jgi:hypothetical protein
VLRIDDGVKYPLMQAVAGDTVVARTAVQVPPSASPQATVVWVVPPYEKP